MSTSPSTTSVGKISRENSRDFQKVMQNELENTDNNLSQEENSNNVNSEEGSLFVSKDVRSRKKVAEEKEKNSKKNYEKLKHKNFNKNASSKSNQQTVDKTSNNKSEDEVILDSSLIKDVPNFIKPDSKTSSSQDAEKIDFPADEGQEKTNQEQKPQTENSKKSQETKDLFAGKSKIGEDEKAFLGDIDAVWSDTGSKKQRIVTVLILALLVSFVAWASWATVDELTRGQGQVIASSRTQVITHLEGGILMEMLVTEGVIVDEGQVLARVQNVAAESVLRDTQNQIYQLEASIQRLQAELSGTPLSYSDEITTAAPEIISLQTQIYNTRQQQFLSEMSVLNSQDQQARYELDELEKRLRTATESVSLTRRRLELALPMFERGLYAEVDVLNLQQEVVNLEGEVQSIENNISKAQTVIEEAQLKKELFKSEYDTSIIAEINELTSERNSLQENITAGTDRVVRTEIRSPMRGVVNRIVLNTKGSAVRPGEPIMEVVPLDDTLLIEAKIRPADIGFIYPQQNAVVKLTAYDFSIFGGLEAHVEQISADTIQDGPNQEYFYLVKLRTNQNSLEYRGETLPIIPGMVASVDIITGKKTIMQYLLKPILKAKDNALRER